MAKYQIATVKIFVDSEELAAAYQTDFGKKHGKSEIRDMLRCGSYQYNMRNLKDAVDYEQEEFFLEIELED